MKDDYENYRLYNEAFYDVARWYDVTPQQLYAYDFQSMKDTLEARINNSIIVSDQIVCAYLRAAHEWGILAATAELTDIAYFKYHWNSNVPDGDDDGSEYTMISNEINQRLMNGEEFNQIISHIKSRIESCSSPVILFDE